MDDRDEMLVRAQTVIKRLRARLTAAEHVAEEPVAIVGMACRFPNAATGESVDHENLDSFWRMTLAGRSAERAKPADRWEDAQPSDTYSADPITASFLKGVDQFDAAFFEIADSEAKEMDPAQRLFLEVAWHALEDSGYSKERLAGSDTGVFVGHTGFHEYLREHMAVGAEIGVYTGTGSGQDVIAGRLAYFLNLHGPALTVNTACSSSLVAIHLARRSLLAGECRLAIAGGVNILGPISMSLARQMGFMAADGRCKVFDERADGFGRGEGCGIVVLKRLSHAEADGDLIHAVIHGSAMNQDGRTNGLTAPNGRLQADLLRRALRNAGVAAQEVGYVETHGTGTSLGDLIEFGALAEVYGVGKGGNLPCSLGSAKANIGHQEGAAGVAGVMRAALAIERGVIPPLAGFRTLNPTISLDGSRFIIPTHKSAWSSEYKARYAGVSSFGWSGTNAHIVLGAAPACTIREHRSGSGQAVIVAVSAPDPGALRSLVETTAEAVWGISEDDLQDFAWSSGSRRSHFALRLAVVGSDRADLVRKLRERAALNVIPVGQSPRVVFSFGGSQLGCDAIVKELSRAEPVFREVAQRCTTAWRAATRESSGLKGDVEQQAQGSLFALYVGFAELMRSWGVQMKFVSGDGVGGVAAALVSRELDFAEAISKGVHHSSGAKRVEAIGAADTVVVRVGSSSEGNENAAGALWLVAFRNRVSARESLLEIVGSLYEMGAEPNWDGIFGADRRMVRLPAYRFQRSKHWLPKRNAPSAEKLAPDDWFYETVWRQKPLPLTDESAMGRSRSDLRKTWLIFADESGLANELSRTLERLGDSFVLVRPSTTFHQTDANEFQANAADRKQIELLLQSKDIFNADELRVVHMQAPDLPRRALDMIAEKAHDAGDSVSSMEACLMSLINLCRALAERATGGSAKLWVVTEGAQAVREEDVSLRLEQSPIEGFASAAALDHPEIWGGTIDLPSLDSRVGDLGETLVRECGTENGEKRLVYRDRLRFVPRLRRAPAPLSAELPLQLHATYLVTGAFGGIGMDLAEWLAANGAKHLVLMGRSYAIDELSTERQKTLLELRKAGIQVRVERCDVADFEQMSQMFVRLRSEEPPLRGILHAAAEVIWKPVTELDDDDVERSFRAKVRGSLVLHELTKAMALDFFVFFSSAAVSIGARNGAVYAAGNSFMDSLALERQSLGLPGLSIQWGQWKRRTAHGAVAEKQFTQSGLEPMNAGKALSALGRLLRSQKGKPNSRQILIARMDVDRLKAGVAARGNSLFLSELDDVCVRSTERVRPAAIAALDACSKADRIEGLTVLVVEQLRRAMDWSAKREVDVTLGFFATGMDSLMSIQFKNYIEAATGVVQSSTLVFLYSNVNAVVGFLYGSLFGAEMEQDTEETSGLAAAADAPSHEFLTDDETRRELVAELELFKGGRLG